MACPDARQPGYEAAAGLQAAGTLGAFLTSYYHDDQGIPASLLRRLPGGSGLVRRLERRTHPAVPPALIVRHPAVDIALAAENRAPAVGVRRSIAMWRTERFDRQVATWIAANRPEVALLFSDVGSVHSLDCCRELGIPSLVSVVHGDVDEERALLESQRSQAPEYFPLYLGDGRLDETELSWLHERRRRDARLAELLLVPSDHIASRLREKGHPADKLRVVPYAADLERFHPRARRVEPGGCTFVFAGGITQRKGISYLLDAWDRVRRQGWRLRLVGPLPNRLGPLAARLATPGLEWVGRVGHAEMPYVLAEADVFVFPSLFEGSAVVTYEAMACGLPLLVTAEAGSVARDGREGMIVPAADVEGLARAMSLVGADADLRTRMGSAARCRAEEFTWTRYHAAVARAVDDLARR